MKLTIWPNHCIIGTTGHAVVPLINEAVQKWAKAKSKSVHYVTKGENLRTEMYSALSADVEDPEDIATAFNNKLMSKLRISDQVIICGQARSHVVKFTVLDILKYWVGEKKRLCLLEDGCSSVQGFEKDGLKFLDDMKKKGLTVVKCNEVFQKDSFTDENVNKDTNQETNKGESSIKSQELLKTLLATASSSSATLEQLLTTLKHMDDRMTALEGSKTNPNL